MSYEKYLDYTQSLRSKIDSARVAMGALRDTTPNEAINALDRRLSDATFHVLVLGEFNRGKSTAINAMLGQKVLPAYARETTAIISEVRYGERPRALLYLRANDSQPRTSAQEVPVDQLEKYVVVPKNTDPVSASDENPYERVVIEWPLPLLRSGVVLVDSPGLNASRAREAITTHYLANADAVVFVTHCSVAGQHSEIAFLDNYVKPLGFAGLFVLCNFFNQIDEESDRRDVVANAQRLFGQYARNAEQGIFFVDARGALQARAGGHAEALKTTQFPAFEASLERFLVDERGRTRVRRVAHDLLRVLRKAQRDGVQDETSMLQVDRVRIEGQQQIVRAELQALSRETDEVTRSIESRRAVMRNETRMMATSLHGEIAANLTEWLSKFQPTTPLTVRDLADAKEAVRRLATEVVDHLHGKVVGAIAAWHERRLTGYMSREISNIQTTLSDRLKRFVERVESLKIAAGGRARPPSRDDAWRQLLGGDPLFRLESKAFADLLVPAVGVEGMHGAIGANVLGVAGAAAAVFIGLPFLAPAALIAGVGAGLWGVKVVTKQVVDDVGSRFAQRFGLQQNVFVERIVEELDARLVSIQDALRGGMQQEVDGIRERFDKALQEHRAGHEAIQLRLAELANIERTLRTIEDDVGDIIQQIG